MWTDAYVGLPYSKYNCAELVETVQQEVFNRTLIIPNGRNMALFAQSRNIQEQIQNYCVKTCTPKDGDLVLMRSCGRLCHIGVFAAPNYVLHSLADFGSSVIERICALRSAKIEAYYTWLK